MGKKNKFNQAASQPPAKKSKSGFVTINSAFLHAAVKKKGNEHGHDRSPASSTTSTNADMRTSDDVGRVRIWQSKTEKVDECCYACTLTEKQPIVIIIEENTVSQLAAVLKGLYPPSESGTSISSITLKSQRQQVSKQLKRALFPTRGIVIISTDCVMFARSCLPDKVHFKTLLHVSDSLVQSDLTYRTAIGNSVVKDIQHIVISKVNAGRIKEKYDINRKDIPVIIARVAAARKLANALQNGSTLWVRAEKDDAAMQKEVETQNNAEEDEEKRALAGKLDGLKQKLKLAMSLELPSKELKDDNTNTPVKEKESQKTIRIKMSLLGMFHTPSNEEMKAQAKSGRQLATTRWMDGWSGSDVCCSDAIHLSNAVKVEWNDVRYGASICGASSAVQSIVEGTRSFVHYKSGRKLPKREKELEVLQSSPKLAHKLRDTRITAFGWRPSPYGEGEDGWGGKYGKSCSHNEVAMFYLRPFVPQEVLNTHCCSRNSPAPGNEGHDGCMEFLHAQCIFYKRGMTIWDDKFFHYVDVEGVHSSVEKKKLLGYTVEEIKKLMSNLRKIALKEDDWMILLQDLVNKIDGTLNNHVLLEDV